MKTKMSLAVLALIGHADGIHHSRQFYKEVKLAQTSNNTQEYAHAESIHDPTTGVRINADGDSNVVNKRLSQVANASSNATAEASNATSATNATANIIPNAQAPYHCTEPSDSDKANTNKYDGLIHNNDTNTKVFPDGGCVVGGVNTNMKKLS